MHRIDTANAVAGLFVEAAGTQPRTLTSEAWGNAVQEEYASFIEAEGITLDFFVRTQLRAAILSRITSAIFETGLLGGFQVFTAPRNMVAGDAEYLLGGAPSEAGVLIVATETVAQGVASLFQLRGNATLPKETASATVFTQGQAVYWHLILENCHDDPTSDRRIIGYAREDRDQADATVDVRLNGTAEFP